jgi:FkbM family methyltransferase
MNDELSKNITLIEDYYWPTRSLSTFEGTKETLNMINGLNPFIKNKNVMVQAGGNCGMTLRPFISIFNTIYTFEPDPINFKCLCLNIPEDNVIKIQSCVGKDHELVKMDFVGNDQGSGHIIGSGNIPTFKIDDLNLFECDLIMLDIEGFELNALKGAIKTIEKYKPVLCIEYYEPWLNRYGYSLNDIYDFMQSYNYKLASNYRTSYSIDLIFINEG